MEQVEDAEDVEAVAGESADHVDERVEIAEEDVPPAAVLKGRVQTVQGIGPARVAALAAIGITTRQDLLDRGATPEGRAAIAEQSQISEKLIASWVSAVDLTRVTGVGPQSAELFQAAGVATVGDLAQQDAASLHEQLVAVNADRKLVRVVPGVPQLEKAIETAKGLPQVVTV